MLVESALSVKLVREIHRDFYAIFWGYSAAFIAKYPGGKCVCFVGFEIGPKKEDQMGKVSYSSLRM